MPRSNQLNVPLVEHVKPFFSLLLSIRRDYRPRQPGIAGIANFNDWIGVSNFAVGAVPVLTISHFGDKLPARIAERRESPDGRVSDSQRKISELGLSLAETLVHNSEVFVFETFGPITALSRAISSVG